MAHINVDLNNVPDDDLHPEGMLHVRVVESEVREKKDKTGKYISWRLDPVNPPTGIKRPVYLITSLTDLTGLKRFLKAAGHSWDSDGTFNTTDVHGRELMVNLEIEEYEGEKQNKVKFPYKPVR